MKFNLDMEEYEQQRYNYIKKKGKYMEVDILIGTEEDSFEGRTGKMPVVTTMLHDCTSKEVACMYLTLKALMGQLKEDYPIECMVAEFGMNTHDIGTIRTDNKEDSEEE